MSYLKDLVRRLRSNPGWVAAQFVLTALLMLIGLAWTRLPDKHVWQVALTLLVPVLLAISALELEAGTMRAFADDDGRRVKLVFGAMALLVWVALYWASWAVLDWCDDQIPNWAAYLNSQSTAHERARLFTYEHIQFSLGILEWLLRWVVVPAKILPYAAASTQWCWRLPWHRIFHFLWNWRWWAGVLLAALVGVELPRHFFAGLPHGTVAHQIWAVALKLVASYVLAIGNWVLLLGWLSILFDRQEGPAENELSRQLSKRLYASRVWIAALFALSLLSLIPDRLPGTNLWLAWISEFLPTVLVIGGFILLVVLVRSLFAEGFMHVRLVWGILSPLAWLALAGAVASLDYFLSSWLAIWLWSKLLIPALFLPFIAASAQWGLRLPWRRILHLLIDWRWLLAIPSAAILAAALPYLIVNALFSGIQSDSYWTPILKSGADGLVQLCILVLLLGWAAVLLGRPGTEPPIDDSLVAVPVGSGPGGNEDSIRLPLPESRDDAGGNA